MNRTNVEHAVYAMLTMLPFGAADEWLAGAAFGAAFFIGREHAQAEAKVRKEGWAKHPYFACLAPKYWSKDAVLDWATPTLACAAVVLSQEILWLKLVQLPN